MTIIISKRNAEKFLRLMNALEEIFQVYLCRELCKDVKLNIVDNKVVLIVSDTLPEFIRCACQRIFELTLIGAKCT